MGDGVRGVLVKFKATTWGVVLLVALLAVCATVLSALDKDPTPVLVVLVPAALQLLNLGRTDQVAAGQTELREKVEEVASNVNGNMSLLIEAKTQPSEPSVPVDPAEAAGWRWDEAGRRWVDPDEVGELAAADVQRQIEALPPRGTSAVRDRETGAWRHTCRRGVPDAAHHLATDEAHCGACALEPGARCGHGRLFTQDCTGCVRECADPECGNLRCLKLREGSGG